MRTLSAFCKSHRRFGDEVPFAAECHFDMKVLVGALRISEVGSRFKSTYGDDVYTTHSGPFVATTMAKLLAYSVVINPVEPTGLKGALVSAMFAKLVPETPINDLIFDLAACQNCSLRKLASEWPHHKLLEAFRELLDATAIAKLPLLCLKIAPVLLEECLPVLRCFSCRCRSASATWPWWLRPCTVSSSRGWIRAVASRSTA